MMVLADKGEAGWIDYICSQVQLSKRVQQGIGDDTAVIDVRNQAQELITSDLLVAGVHFDQTVSAYDVGYKALAVNISDIVAMCGCPLSAVIGLAAPAQTPWQWLRECVDGMVKIAQTYDVDIVGGDTVRSSQLMIAVTMTGQPLAERVIYRHGAKPGDEIWVTGPLGGSLKSGRHTRFRPRYDVVKWLAASGHLPQAMMDLSDGLAKDLKHLSDCSQVGINIQSAAVPCHDGVTLDAAFQDGEDFELLMAITPGDGLALQQSCPENIRLFKIGEVTDQHHQVRLYDEQGLNHVVVAKGFQHF